MNGLPEPLPDILKLAQAAPPRCVAAFRTRFTAEAAVAPVAAFTIACSSCSGDRFLVFERKIVAKTYVTAVGLALQCCGCGAVADFFDMRRDGYDGEFGHNDFIQGVVEQEALQTEAGEPFGEVMLKAAFVYNIEFAELESITSEEDKRAQDLFDAFGLAVHCDNRWVEAAWTCECA